MNPLQSHHSHPVRAQKIRRAIIAEDEDETRTVRPRSDVSALNSELCERDVLEINWETLGEKNSSVFDIYTGLKIDEAPVKAGREIEAKRMLEFDVCDDVSEELANGKRFWHNTWLQQQKNGSGKVEIGGQPSPKCMQTRRRVCGHTTNCSDALHFVACCVSWSWPLLRFVGCICGIVL